MWAVAQAPMPCGLPVRGQHARCGRVIGWRTERAHAKAKGGALDCTFVVADFLGDAISCAPFKFIFDLGCFHLFDELKERRRFSERVASLLDVDGRWWASGSSEGPARDYGPPRRSARDIILASWPLSQFWKSSNFARSYARQPYPFRLPDGFASCGFGRIPTSFHCNSLSNNAMLRTL